MQTELLRIEYINTKYSSTKFQVATVGFKDDYAEYFKWYLDHALQLMQDHDITHVEVRKYINKKGSQYNKYKGKGEVIVSFDGLKKQMTMYPLVSKLKEVSNMKDKEPKKEPREVSYSQLNQFNKCRRAFKYSYIDRLEQPTARPLTFGGDLHELEEAYQQQIMDGVKGNKLVKEVVAKIKSEFESLPEQDKVELGYNYINDVVSVFNEFVQARKNNPEYAQEKVIYNEEPFKLKLSSELILKGIIDRVVQIGDKYYIKELKTFKSVKPNTSLLYWQAQHYLYANAVQKKYGIKIDGFIYEYVCSVPPKEPQFTKTGVLAASNSYATPRTFKKLIGREPNKLELPKLTGAQKYYIRVVFPYNENVKKVTLANFKKGSSRLIEAVENKDYNTFLASSFDCGMCKYKRICEAYYTEGKEAEQLEISTFKKRV